MRKTFERKTKQKPPFPLAATVKVRTALEMSVNITIGKIFSRLKKKGISFRSKIYFAISTGYKHVWFTVTPPRLKSSSFDEWDKLRSMNWVAQIKTKTKQKQGRDRAANIQRSPAIIFSGCCFVNLQNLFFAVSLGAEEMTRGN